MFHPHQNFITYHFFDPCQSFVDSYDPYDLCQSLTHVTHETMYLHYPRYPRYLADS